MAQSKSIYFLHLSVVIIRKSVKIYFIMIGSKTWQIARYQNVPNLIKAPMCQNKWCPVNLDVVYKRDSDGSGLSVENDS